MMKNLHARSTPTRDSENPEPQTVNPEPSLSEAIRAGQSEAIAEALQVGRTVHGEPSPSEIPNVKSQIASNPTTNSKLQNLKSKIILVIGTSLVIGAWLLVILGSPLPPFAPVQNSCALLAELPSPSPTALGSWLISAVAALSILALGKQFMRKTPLEAEFLTKREFQDFKDKDFADLRNRIDHSHPSVSTKLDGINNRLHDVASLVARLDERTKVHAVPQPSTD